MTTSPDARLSAKAAAWSVVKLTEAHQVEALIGDDPDFRSDPDVAVRAGYDRLRATGRTSAALEYLGHALPRLEAVSWAARIVADAAAAREPAPRARQALDKALRWLDDPTEAHRRAAGLAADAAGKLGAEQCLARAVFYSGGSVAPAGAGLLHPPPHACARFAVSAIEQVAYDSDDTAAFLLTALDLGEAVAERGIEALRQP